MRALEALNKGFFFIYEEYVLLDTVKTKYHHLVYFMMIEVVFMTVSWSHSMQLVLCFHAHTHTYARTVQADIVRLKWAKLV